MIRRQRNSEWFEQTEVLTNTSVSKTGSTSGTKLICCRPNVVSTLVCTPNRGKYMTTRCTEANPLNAQCCKPYNGLLAVMSQHIRGNSEDGSMLDKNCNCCRPSVFSPAVCTPSRGRYMTTRCTEANPSMHNAARQQ